MSLSLSADSILDAIPVHEDSPWLAERRASATDRLRRTGFPATSEENWKSTRVPEFVSEQPHASPGSVTADDLAPFMLDGMKHLMVFVDGKFAPDLSQLDGLPHAFHAESLAQASQRGGKVLDQHLDTTGPRNDAFADWNMAAWRDGAFVTSAVNTVVDEPLHILHVRASNGRIFPRVLVHLRDGSQASIIEHHVSIGSAAGTTVAVTELVAHPGANLRHDRVQEEGPGSNHMHCIFADAGRDATIARGEACLGAAHSRVSVEAAMSGEGAHFAMEGLFIVGGTRRTDVWTRFDHAVPNTTSKELVKGVLTDKSRGAFTGNVLVRRDAQKTSAEQENRNLILSNGALVDAKPQLEIHADDVQCSHGSTVGQLDEDAVFFLQARGIGHDQARLILTKAFLVDAIENMPDALKTCINQRIEAWFERHGTVEATA